ncbi:hypothetical protein KP509_38G050900 [Ceratopteris richardii]|uniref:MYND-type domain-containing protein n=1 Tax=Ceratopteris richardii TaxID=49495 RepID=A0A8T2Q5Q2_CERRI|nr:hypothetical protein KP509_38G050900 [Ceratopteris richardii]
MKGRATGSRKVGTVIRGGEVQEVHRNGENLYRRWRRSAQPMRTRRNAYTSPSDGIAFYIRPRLSSCKQRRVYLQDGAATAEAAADARKRSCCLSLFDRLHDDLLVSIMVALTSSATAPCDLINAMLTCRRFCVAATHPSVLATASSAVLIGSARKWSPFAQMFLKRCSDLGNAEAAYTLGMISFYCFRDHEAGASHLAQAAAKAHASALHSLAIIQFNGSGATRRDKNLRYGASLCAKAATLGHVDAMRELGHCLQDGYGVPRNVPEGRCFLLEANALEAAAAVAASPRDFLETASRLVCRPGPRCPLNHVHHPRNRHNQPNNQQIQSSSRVLHKLDAPHRIAISIALIVHAFRQPVFSQQGSSRQQTREGPSLPFPCHLYRLLRGGDCSLLSDVGSNVPSPKLHTANRFLVEWFNLHPPGHGLRLCSNAICGRSETRRHEFRRCSACGTVNYCSRACQSLDWRSRHKYHCRPVADWGADAINGEEAHGDGDDNNEYGGVNRNERPAHG